MKNEWVYGKDEGSEDIGSFEKSSKTCNILFPLYNISDQKTCVIHKEIAL